MIGFFETIYNVIKSIVNDIVSVLDLLTGLADVIKEWLSFLPTQALAAFATMLTIVIVYKVIGRS